MVKVFPFNTPSTGEGIISCLFSFCFTGGVEGGTLQRKIICRSLGCKFRVQGIKSHRGVS